MSKVDGNISSLWNDVYGQVNVDKRFLRGVGQETERVFNAFTP